MAVDQTDKMNFHIYAARAYAYAAELDPSLLVFLILVVNVKLYVKIAAIGIFFVLHYKSVFPLRAVRGWQRFYLVMILLALLNFVLSISVQTMPSLLAFCLGAGYWLLALAAAWHIRVFVSRGDPARISRTLSFFFLLNAAATVVSFIIVCLRSGSINPFTYEGEYRKYFISTGDYITGIGLDGSVTTALTGALGVLYFLHSDKKGYALVCLGALLLAASNFIDLLLMVILLFMFLFRSDRIQKSWIILCFLSMVVFSAKVSPQNKDYTAALIGQVLGKERYVAPTPLPHPTTNEFVEGRATVQKRHADSSLLYGLYTTSERDSITAAYSGWDHSGRLIAWKELVHFFKAHPGRLIFGTGMGNFSSRLAFKTSGLGMDGGYPEGQRYIHPFFWNNYLFNYLYYHSRDEGQHSVVNKPDSVYGQLLAEYGFAGLFSFYLLYVVFFIKRARRHAYGLPMLLLLGAAFFTEYWFEQLSVVILFELLLLSDGGNDVLLKSNAGGANEAG